MAVIKCKNCGKEISDTTKYCVHCGHPVKEEVEERPIVNIYANILTLLPFLEVGFIWLLWNLTDSYLISLIVNIIVFLIASLILLKKDYQRLKSSNVDTDIIEPFHLSRVSVPKYLWKRSKILSQNCFRFLLWIIGFIFFVIVVIFEINPFSTKKEDLIAWVKTSTYEKCPGFTVEEVLGTHISNLSWSSDYDNVTQEAIVTAEGKIGWYDKKERIRITYRIEGEYFYLQQLTIAGESKGENVHDYIIDNSCEIQNEIYNADQAEEEVEENETSSPRNYQEINFNEFETLADKSSPSLFYIRRDTCSYCKEMDPIMKEIALEYDIPVFAIDIDDWTTSEVEALFAIDPNGRIGGTPSLIIVYDNYLQAYLSGLTEKENIVDFLYENSML